MRHSKLYEERPHCRRIHMFSAMTRTQLETMRLPTWRQLALVEHDELAKRQLVKQMHGVETLQNWIRGCHGLPNSH